MKQISSETIPSETMSTRGSRCPPRGKKGHLAFVKGIVKPPAVIPSKNKENPLDKVEVAGFQRRRKMPNALGLLITAVDTCHHLSGWKGGVCTVQGNKPCPFLGSQQSCEAYLSREDGKEMMRSRRNPGARFLVDTSPD